MLYMTISLTLPPLASRLRPRFVAGKYQKWELTLALSAKPRRQSKSRQEAAPVTGPPGRIARRLQMGTRTAPNSGVGFDPDL
jgi:hypothetical protein